VAGRPAARPLRRVGVVDDLDLRLLNLEAVQRVLRVEAVFDREERNDLLNGLDGGDAVHFESF